MQLYANKYLPPWHFFFSPSLPYFASERKIHLISRLGLQNVVSKCEIFHHNLSCTSHYLKHEHENVGTRLNKERSNEQLNSADTNQYFCAAVHTTLRSAGSFLLTLDQPGPQDGCEWAERVNAVKKQTLTPETSLFILTQRCQNTLRHAGHKH